MIFQVLILICCIAASWVQWRGNPKKSTLSPPLLSGGLPIIGHAWKFLGDRKHAFNLVKSVAEETFQRGGVLTMNMGSRMMYVITDPYDCAKISNACLDKDYYYSFAKRFVGNGLLVADVPVWKHHRKYLNPAFLQKNLIRFLSVFNHHAKRLVNQFKPKVGKGPFNHEEYFKLNSLESICMTAFGADIAEFGGLHKQYQDGVKDILDIFTERFQKFWLHSNFIYKWSSLKKKENDTIQKIEEFTRLILKKRKAEMEENQTHSDKSGQFIPFMNLILDLSKEIGSFTDEDVLYETNAIVAGGYDSTAYANTLVLMMLGSHPEAQKKVYEELQEVFGNSNRDAEEDDLPKLVYLEVVLKETMRLFPIAPIIARYLVNDVQLKNYTLKAGHGIGMLIWAMHRHPLWGPDVEHFRPERWLDGTLSSNPRAFAAFSTGRRSCIGKTYAMLSMKTTLSHVLRSYRITSDISKLEFRVDAMLKPACGQNISIEERK